MHFSYKTTQKACYMASVTSALVNNYATLLYLTFQRSFGISILQVGTLMAVNFVTQMIVDVIGARFSEKIGYRKFMISAQAMIILGLVLMTILPHVMAHKFAALVIAVICSAIGSGIIEVFTSPIIEALPSDSKSASLSLQHSFYSWGMVAVIGISTLFFHFFGIQNWPVLTLLWTSVPLVTLILFILVPINQLNAEKSGFRHLFGSGLFWIFMLFMVCSGAAEIAMSQWASFFAEEGLKVSKTVGDLLGPCLFAVFMGISRVLYPILHDKISLSKYMFLSSIGCIATYMIASLSHNPYLSLMGCALTGFFVGIAWPGTLSLAAEYNPKGGAAMFGILALAGDLGCTMGPEMVVLGASKLNILASPIHAGLLISALFPILMILCLCVLKKTNKNQKE
ncbi:MAG: MFS transporter [Clostridia bacterium]|nr:MFS transporter [Clostridia bacterium]